MIDTEMKMPQTTQTGMDLEWHQASSDGNGLIRDRSWFHFMDIGTYQCWFIESEFHCLGTCPIMSVFAPADYQFQFHLPRAQLCYTFYYDPWHLIGQIVSWAIMIYSSGFTYAYPAPNGKQRQYVVHLHPLSLNLMPTSLPWLNNCLGE